MKYIIEIDLKENRFRKNRALALVRVLRDLARMLNKNLTQKQMIHDYTYLGMDVHAYLNIE